MFDGVSNWTLFFWSLVIYLVISGVVGAVLHKYDRSTSEATGLLWPLLLVVGVIGGAFFLPFYLGLSLARLAMRGVEGLADKVRGSS